ncbi:endolytic transglycosylase MltG [Pseudobacteriovorax antillogorgiicola]|uniref:Endolytic murein transglycosylase n=1 Tax=Pseudobacteriovorax antillogorgiicola TaxID=1513793 RepID=A0A1Y6CH14_9BACT|nr:endolytic transglycosylase MltG [Pseudobacteriovorax antillogorgiicola]TCS48677.1 UPF0755 protein [Pseudobacteriovorax antillogorgiicola]SMF54935.1 UPF0755 protein [Pseudobacteriovorax antillogorgiicola]
MLKRLLGYLIVIVGLIGVGSGFYYFKMKSWGERQVFVEKASVIHFPAGTKLDALAGALEASGVIDDALNFKVWVKMFGHYHRYQAGRYRFSGQISPVYIDQKMSLGKTYTPITLQFVIPEGFTLKQVVNRLVANSVGEYQELWTLAHDQAFLKELKIKNQNLEGFLYPATYSFTSRPTAKDVFRKMVATFWENLPPNYLERIKNKKLSLKQAVTFASLIEMETTHEDEKTMISEVIWNRLKKGEPLGIDAALIYGIKDYQGDIKWKHLKDAKNPYNTRIHKGLPPGPIGAVSGSTLEAVLNPTDEGYYYYVLKAGTTRHYFTKTLKEHNKYVKLLLENQK